MERGEGEGGKGGHLCPPLEISIMLLETSVYEKLRSSRHSGSLQEETVSILLIRIIH